MKYMIEYKIRLEGLSFENYLKSDAALLAVFNQWAPVTDRRIGSTL